MSAIEDGAMQHDDLVRRIRADTDPGGCDLHNAADAIEEQASELTRLRERNAELEKALIGTLAALAAATSLLSRSSKKAAASDKMFDMMLKDYVKALDAGRDAIASSESVVKSEGEKDGVE